MQIMDTGIFKRGSCLSYNYENYSSLLNHLLKKKKKKDSSIPKFVLRSVKQLVTVGHYVNKRRDTSSSNL